MLMTTDPGDLVLDPTCGSGTTAYVAEQWGRRWITDRHLARAACARAAAAPDRDLPVLRAPGSWAGAWRRDSSTSDDRIGRARRSGASCRTSRSKSIANEEPAAEEVLVDRPEVDSKITRVSGPFAVEATIPTPSTSRATGSRTPACPTMRATSIGCWRRSVGIRSFSSAAQCDRRCATSACRRRR